MLNKIMNTKEGKIVLGLVILNMILGIYDIIKASSYISYILTIIISIAFIVLIGLLILCASKYNKTSIILNILLSILLIIGLITLNRTSQFTDKITNTTEYEVVDIVVLKDSKLSIDSDLKDKVMGSFLDDELGLKRAREILLENNKDGVRERLYDNMLDAHNDLLDGTIDMLVLTEETISYLEEEVNYEEKMRSLFSKNYEIATNYVTEDIDVLNEPFTIYAVLMLLEKVSIQLADLIQICY